MTDCAVARLLQNGEPAYEIVAAGKVVIVKVLGDIAFPHGAFPVAVSDRTTLPAVISVGLGL